MPSFENTIAKGRFNEQKKLALLDFMSQNLSDLSKDPQHLQKMIKELQELGRESLELFDSLFDDFEKLKESNVQLEEKLSQMAEKLDEISSSMQEGDYNANKCLCAQKYSAFWSKLDDASKDFLITANYLCKRCEGEQFDFSPVIVEMSRVYENELLEKIFCDFITQKANSVIVLQPEGARDVLHKIISDVKNGFPMFISLTQMVKELKRIQGHTRGSYGRALMDELQVDWDTNKLSDTVFYNQGISYATNYRNRAAHPGSQLCKIDADDCDSLSQSLLVHFIGSMK